MVGAGIGINLAGESVQAGVPPTTSVTIEQVLSKLERDSLNLLVNHRLGGLLLDQGPSNDRKVCNIAAEGFAMCAMVAGVANGHLERQRALETIDKVLSVLENNPQLRHKGWMCHLIDVSDPEKPAAFISHTEGMPSQTSEFSTIDTALFMMGALIARQYFGNDLNLSDRIQKLFDDLDFASLLPPPAEKRGFILSHGFSAEGERIKWNWDTCSEGILVSFLSQAQHKPTVPSAVWNDWDRRLFSFPLFISYYPHSFLDLKDMVDESGLDLRARAQAKMEYHYKECEDAGMQNGLFGITACHAYINTPGGKTVREYVINPSPTPVNGNVIIAPHAVVASLPFIPRTAERAIMYLNERGWLNAGYGPFNSVNIGRDLVDSTNTSIDVGSATMGLPSVQRVIFEVSANVPEFKLAMERCRIRSRHERLVSQASEQRSARAHKEQLTDLLNLEPRV